MKKPKKGDWLRANEYSHWSKYARSTIYENKKIKTRYSDHYGTRVKEYQWKGKASINPCPGGRIYKRKKPREGQTIDVQSSVDYDIALWLEEKCNQSFKDRSTVIHDILKTAKQQEKKYDNNN